LMLQGLFTNDHHPKFTEYARLLDSGMPLFSQFGQNVYASDVVQTCIDIIAAEISKLRPRHIRRDDEGLIEILKRSRLNRLFRFGPNKMMSIREFLEKVTWLLYLNYNCFIFPTYEVVEGSRGNQSKVFTGFYPLNPIQVDFLQDPSKTLFV